MNKKAIVTIIISVCTITFVQAQSLKEQGTGVEQLIPDGWSHDEVKGDLVVKVLPNYKEKMHTRDDGYIFNFNQPILAIYFGTADGMLTLWRQYDHVLSADDNEDCMHEVNLEITDRGVLIVSTSLAYSMGGWGSYTDRYFYRYQNGDFYLIGKENVELMRNTGEVTTVSENYLTWKRQEKKEDISEEKLPKEKWTRLTKQPLENWAQG